MNINGNEVNIDDLFSDKYMHKVINDNMFLSDYQIEILNKYKIDYKSCGSARELLYYIEEILEEEEYEDLETTSREISEFSYYNNTNK